MYEVRWTTAKDYDDGHYAIVIGHAKGVLRQGDREGDGMKYVVHFGRGDWEDQFVAEGDDIEEIIEKADEFFRSRSIDKDTLDVLWIERVE